MRAWRVHQYGAPLDVLQLDEVPVPVPDAGDLLVKVEGIPLNLNDLERINGGNMMVRPELPYSPGMEVMGTVAPATRSRPSAPRSLLSTCPTTSPCPTRRRCSSRSTWPGWACSTGRS
jgi:threonine dehydrogenase-like Zn-dependent dehydrogenase